MKLPHPIPYQGSKRHLARFILPLFPHKVETLIEPFAGSAAITIAAASQGKASRFHLNDLNKPLMALWADIIHTPERISAEYEHLWQAQAGHEREFYDRIRDEFNASHKPGQLLYLLARCVKAAVRYNARGDFNQSPDNRRKGRNPEQMADDIFRTSHLLRGRTILTALDYREVLDSASTNDLVYLDPPYQGVCGAGDPRYYSAIEFEELLTGLELLNTRKLAFVLRYDGRTGNRSYGSELPPELELLRLEVKAGRSSQSTLLGGESEERRVGKECRSRWSPYH